MHGLRGPTDPIDIQPVFLGELALREVAFPLSKVVYIRAAWGWWCPPEI